MQSGWIAILCDCIEQHIVLLRLDMICEQTVKIVVYVIYGITYTWSCLREWNQSYHLRFHGLSAHYSHVHLNFIFVHLFMCIMITHHHLAFSHFTLHGRRPRENTEHVDVNNNNSNTRWLHRHHIDDWLCSCFNRHIVFVSKIDSPFASIWIGNWRRQNFYQISQHYIIVSDFFM